jgi:hypothetical protein
MSDKPTYMRAFNKHFFEFLDDIISIYPDNQEIISARNSFDTVKRANPTAIVKVWYKFVYIPYKDIIDKGDITFFFEKDYNSDLSHLANSNEILDIIDKIRGPVKGMSDVNKQHSVKYLENLCKLSLLYTNSQ